VAKQKTTMTVVADVMSVAGPPDVVGIEYHKQHGLELV
jgi:hypothetical protein